MSGRARIDRRDFLRIAGSAMLVPPAAGVRVGQAPAIASGPKPSAPFGVAAGDVGGGRAVIWSRADRSARMFVDYATTESFTNPRRVHGPAALEGSDFTCRTSLTDLPPGQRIFYRVLSRICPICAAGASRPSGSFTTPAVTPRDVTHRLVRRHRRPGLGHQPGLGRPADSTRPCAGRSRMSSSTLATRSTPISRSKPK